jgi:hypothetical protein
VSRLEETLRRYGTVVAIRRYGRDRKLDGENRSRLGVAHFDGAAIGPAQVAHDGQTETETAVLSVSGLVEADEALEDAVPFRGSNTRPVVSDAEYGVLAASADDNIDS